MSTEDAIKWPEKPAGYELSQAIVSEIMQLRVHQFNTRYLLDTVARVVDAWEHQREALIKRYQELLAESAAVKP